ncbi:MAG: hypothetical protein AAGJ08_04295 [Cyanobacteria bacterium P01_H01_bin.35]
MTKKVDVSSKRIIGISPKRWVEWVSKIPNVTACRNYFFRLPVVLF